MAEHQVAIQGQPQPIRVPTGTLLVEAIERSDISLTQPCGGQGRCGRCVVKVDAGAVRMRSTLRLAPEDLEQGYALACQSVIEADVHVVVPPQEKIERLLTSDRTAIEVEVPVEYDPRRHQAIQRVALDIQPPGPDYQRDDWTRLQNALRSWREETGLPHTSHPVRVALPLLARLGHVLRGANWQVAAVLDTHSWDLPEAPDRLIDLQPAPISENQPLWGVALDIGTTTITLWLVDLINGKVRAQLAEYNGQVARGEDVISRIIYASKNDGGREMQSLVLKTINDLIELACKRVGARPEEIVKAVVSGNTTMIHLFLGIPAATIRLSPFVPAANHFPLLQAGETGLNIHPAATIDCLPGVASYVGADITAGVLSSGLYQTDRVTLFMDIGTNGEMVLGCKDWLVTCACSAGPAFEGAGVQDGMRATKGAIEEVWINGHTYEPTIRVIGGTKPRGLCGSGLISLLAELFLTGVVDKGGNINLHLDSTRVRKGDHGPEYVLVWKEEAAHGRDIVITRVDIDNLLRAKAAVYAGFTVLSERVGVPLETVEQVLVGGAFGQYINVEKAIEIGLLPDLPWDRFHFLGNTSVQGAYRALLDWRLRHKVEKIADGMTYVELSADNAFYEAFTSALFLPHTDLSRFPSVASAMGALERVKPLKEAEEL